MPGKKPSRPFPGTEPPEERRYLPSDPMPADPEDSGVSATPADAPIMMVPVGEFDEKLIDKIRPQLEEVFRRPTAVHPCLPVPKYAHNPTREQYNAASILKRVETARHPDWDSAIGLTHLDLFVPETPYVFGEADRSTRSSVISTTRLFPDTGAEDAKEEAGFRRLITELIHQVGLIRGLATCANNRCVMFQSQTTQDTDKKGMTFCANCRKRLVY